MYDCGARAEFYALAVVFPGLAAFGANGRVALERAVTFGFDKHAGLIAGRNFQSKRTIVGMGFDAGAVPIFATE